MCLGPNQPTKRSSSTTDETNPGAARDQPTTEGTTITATQRSSLQQLQDRASAAAMGGGRRRKGQSGAAARRGGGGNRNRNRPSSSSNNNNIDELERQSRANAEKMMSMIGSQREGKVTAKNNAFDERRFTMGGDNDADNAGDVTNQRRGLASDKGGTKDPVDTSGSQATHTSDFEKHQVNYGATKYIKP